jgi:hypothetical protein
MKFHIFKGVVELLESPSGVFGLLCLAVIGFVSWKQPTLGSAALASFAAVVPAILALAEHRETMCQMQQGYQVPLPPPIVISAPSVSTPQVNAANPSPPTDPTSV